MLIKPITLGGVSFPSNLIQAPLAGVSCAPFRELIWNFGGPAYCATEMISAKTLLQNPPKRYVYKSKTEGPLCFQLSGNHPDELKQAAQIAVEKYAANLIDLNCGCPVDKIRKKGCGSKLLSQSQKLYQIIKAIKEEIKIPLSIKIRVDGDSKDRFNQDVIKAINDAGADFIVVHGRHWNEHYETKVHLDEIAKIVTDSNIPIIGNGDIKDYETLKAMFSTNCAGAMIGRASVGQPWLFQKLIKEDQGESFTYPTVNEIGKIFIQHIENLCQLENETIGVLQARSLSKYYARTANLPKQTQIQFSKPTQLDELQQIIHQVFK